LAAAEGQPILGGMGRFLRLLVVAAALAGPAMADQKDERLDKLFDALLAAGSPQEAQLAERMIWSVWLESGSPTVDLLMQKGVAAMSEGDVEPALAMFNAVIELAPDYAEGWNKRATLYFLMGRLEESIADCQRTLKLEPRHFGALSGLGMIYAQLGQDAKALDAYRRALAVDPQLVRERAEVERLTKKVRGDRI
jgi:tetratricopeptide (TPR) repeat protein